MPITISRTGQRTEPQIKISQEERDRLWAAVLRTYIQKNPAILEERAECPIANGAPRKRKAPGAMTCAQSHEV